MFERIAFSPEYQHYEPVVVSQPPEGPWMIVFENVISDEEAERLIELGGLQGYERSADVGPEKLDGTFEQNVNSGRTSTNAWCLGECNEDPVAQKVMKRIENITGIPEVNSENLQLLRYENYQFYQTHNDYIPYQVDRPTGVRILTFYIYLSDVEEGGGTNFPYVNKTVTPKRGRAALWPSVLDKDPNSKDIRTDHQALPVITGVKYGANAWIHQRDYKGASKKGC
jgi:prolyl 4-hydroxylase